MKKVILNLTLVLFTMMMATVVQAGRPSSGDKVVFEALFGGAISGQARSDPTALSGNILLLGFRNNFVLTDGYQSDVDFAAGFIEALEKAGYAGFNTCFGGGMEAGTFQVYTDRLQSETAVARFWFWAYDADGGSDVQYALSVNDTDGLLWSDGSGSGDHVPFPPGLGETIFRSAEHWQIGPAKRNNKSACSGEGDFSPGDEVTVTLRR